MRNGMTCPKDRGGCGKPLAWDDGAFCQECMTKALYERKNVFSPTKIIICNDHDNECSYLDAWYNGGVSCHARCKKGAWEGIKSHPPNEGCKTPPNCPFLQKQKATQRQV